MHALKEPRQVGLCSVRDAAEFLGLSRGKLYQLINAGQIPVRRFGASVRIPWVWLHNQAALTPQESESVTA